MKGRNPKPAALLLVTGSKRIADRKRPEPVADGRLEDPPAWLTKAQRDGWKYAIEHAPRSVLRRIDRGLLAAWVTAEDCHRQARMALAMNGLVDSRSGKASPYVAIATAQAQIMIRTAADMGFTPVSRARIALGGGATPEPDGKDKSDPAQEFFRTA
jgi:P27 family predicted phage terminase small subunit